MSVSRVLLVRRGQPPATSVASLPRGVPGEGEVLVTVKAAALTPTDLLLCAGPLPALDDPGPRPGEPFVPGIFFCGEVAALGAFVEGLEVGEPVFGVANSAHPACADTGAPVASNGTSASAGCLSQCKASADERDACEEGEGTHPGGCYRETVCVHFSALLPAGALLSSSSRAATVVAHVPPMVNALYCASSHLRMRAGEALLIVTKRLSDVAFLLQRLFIVNNAWDGPLYLVVLHGRAPTRDELERHPLLRPLLARSAGGEDNAPLSFVDDFVGLSVEDQSPARPGGGAPAEQAAEALRELVARVVEATGGAGVDAVLALGVDLAPPAPSASTAREFEAQAADEDALEAEAAVAGDPAPRPPTLLRVLLGALALRGRLVTDCPRLEVMPAEGEHLWAKEASISFLNPHCLPLSSARHGSLLHALAEVMGRLTRGELPMADSEVVQYRLFDQFQIAMEAGNASPGQRGASGGRLVAVVL